MGVFGTVPSEGKSCSLIHSCNGERRDHDKGVKEIIQRRKEGKKERKKEMAEM
jgi:hypothetical protein